MKLIRGVRRADKGTTKNSALVTKTEMKRNWMVTRRGKVKYYTCFCVVWVPSLLRYFRISYYISLFYFLVPNPRYSVNPELWYRELLFTNHIHSEIYFGQDSYREMSVRVVRKVIKRGKFCHIFRANIYRALYGCLGGCQWKGSRYIDLVISFTNTCNMTCYVHCTSIHGIRIIGTPGISD
jgi:hypothetical protein